LVLVSAGGGVIGATAFGSGLTLAVKALAPGIMVMGIIFFMGTISGAHLNPVVTLAFAIRGNFPCLLPGYIGAQLAGALLASLVLQWMFGGIINGATEPTPHIGIWVAMLTEAILTLGLVSVILGMASGARNVGVNGALAIGGYIGLVSVWAAPVTGASMNPGAFVRSGRGRWKPDPRLDLPARPDHRRDCGRCLRARRPAAPSHAEAFRAKQRRAAREWLPVMAFHFGRRSSRRTGRSQGRSASLRDGQRPPLTPTGPPWIWHR
jgi:hypothetical protein